jgi:predicted nucleotidyltransferase
MNHPVSPDIISEIQRRLDEVERVHQVVILYACESGSRAWGFASADSDYDVRFIYVRPIDWYLSIDLERRRDVLELPLDAIWDINGWDLRKALLLMRKTNPPLNEWLASPIVYRDRGWFGQRMREIAPQVYNSISARYHYLRMATGNFREFLRGDLVIRKKYLYVLRPLLAVRWIEHERGVVPTEFEKLLEGTVTDSQLLAEVAKLLRIKRAGNELDRGPRLPTIHAFLEQEIARLQEKPAISQPPEFDPEILNELFRDTLRTYAPSQT